MIGWVGGGCLLLSGWESCRDEVWGIVDVEVVVIYQQVMTLTLSLYFSWENLNGVV